MNESAWYQELIRPSWAPPSWLFGPVWSVLYLLIAISFGYVFYQIYQGAIPKVITIPFVLNLIFNFSFTYFQFGLKNNVLASVDILLVWGTIIWFMVAIWPYVKWVALVNVPYLAWVSFATVLQLTITYLNR